MAAEHEHEYENLYSLEESPIWIGKTNKPITSSGVYNTYYFRFDEFKSTRLVIFRQREIVTGIRIDPQNPLELVVNPDLIPVYIKRSAIKATENLTPETPCTEPLSDILGEFDDWEKAVVKPEQITQDTVCRDFTELRSENVLAKLRTTKKAPKVLYIPSIKQDGDSTYKKELILIPIDPELNKPIPFTRSLHGFFLVPELKKIVVVHDQKGKVSLQPFSTDEYYYQVKTREIPLKRT